MGRQGMIVEYGFGKLGMASSSRSITTVPPSSPSLDYYLYPPPMATYEEIVASPQRFIETLQKFHASIQTKFRIPIIGGQELDLYRLFVEVTSRGGIMKTLQEKKWKEVTSIFSFPPSATNAAFILRRHYFSLLFHYEQVYFFKARGCSKNTSGTFQSTSKVTVPPCASAGPELSPLALQVARPEQHGEHSAKPLPGGTPVHGVIDGEFEGGYLITVIIGSEKLKGILYQTLLDAAHQEQHQNIHQYHKIPMNDNKSFAVASRLFCRRRRKKAEIRKRDPSHPKPNRSGYNFFFKEHHARLKRLYPGRDKALSRIVGDSWNELTESEKAVYREKAVKDKERYRTEMEAYKEGQRAGQTTYRMAPIQQHSDESYGNFTQMHKIHQNERANSFQALMNEVCFDKRGEINLNVKALQRTADDVPSYSQPLETDFNVMESDDKLETDEDSVSAFGNENSSNMSAESELDAAQVKEFHRLEPDANVMAIETADLSNSDMHVAPVSGCAIPMQQQLVETDMEIRNEEKEKSEGVRYVAENAWCSGGIDENTGDTGGV